MVTVRNPYISSSFQMKYISLIKLDVFTVTYFFMLLIIAKKWNYALYPRYDIVNTASKVYVIQDYLKSFTGKPSSVHATEETRCSSKANTQDDDWQTVTC